MIERPTTPGKAVLQRLPSRLAWVLVGAASLGSVLLAVLAQHRYGMEPCPWCILQRMLFIGIGMVSLVAAVLPVASRGAARLMGRMLAGVVLLMAVSGMAAALYQNQVASKSASCDMTLADRIISGLGADAWWPDLFEVRANCADAAVSLLGVPFELWSLALFGVLGAVALGSALGKGR